MTVDRFFSRSFLFVLAVNLGTIACRVKTASPPKDEPAVVPQPAAPEPVAPFVPAEPPASPPPAAEPPKPDEDALPEESSRLPAERRALQVVAGVDRIVDADLARLLLGHGLRDQRR